MPKPERLSDRTTEPVDVRFIQPEEIDAFIESDARGFATDMHPHYYDLSRNFLEIDRCVGAFDRGRFVGQGAALTWRMALPGGADVGSAAITYVSVLPTHHRRGVLTRMMGDMLDQAVERGEPTATLLASESIIYGRFGFGIGVSAASLEIDRRYAALRRPIDIGGEMAIVEPEEAEVVGPQLWERVWRAHPGEMSRSPGWWLQFFSDHETDRDGLTHRFYVVHRDDAGDVDGFAGYRYKEQWDPEPHHDVRVSPIVATSPEVRQAMQAWFCQLDLVGNVHFIWVPLDEPFRWALREPRRLRQTAVWDALWVRVLDIPIVLSARTYRPVDALVLDVHDAFRPAIGGRFLLDAGPDGAECKPTEREPELCLGMEDLGAIVLGGTRPSTLARAGRASGSPDVLARADALFATDVPPYCSSDF